MQVLSCAEELNAKDQIGERLVAFSLASIYTRQADTDCRVAQATGFFQAQTDHARSALFSVAQCLDWLQKGETARAGRAAEQALAAAIKGHYRRAELAAYLRLSEIAIREGFAAEALAHALKAAADAESYEYAAEQDYAEAIAAFLAAKRKDVGVAGRYLRSLESRASWKACSPARDIVAGTLNLMAGERWTQRPPCRDASSAGVRIRSRL